MRARVPESARISFQRKCKHLSRGKQTNTMQEGRGREEGRLKQVWSISEHKEALKAA